MFDLSFAEIAVIACVGLLVVGPNEIPGVVRGAVKAVRSVSHWVSDMKQKLSDAVELDELHNAAKDIHEVTGKQFILDDDGNYREVYDIQSFISEKSQKISSESAEMERENG